MGANLSLGKILLSSILALDVANGTRLYTPKLG
jgi:hypothetical protein